MTKLTGVIIEGCIHFGLKKEEAKTVLQILLTEEQRSDMVYWILRNLNAKMEPIDVIIAAGDIQWKYKQLSNMKEVNIPFNQLTECSPSEAKVTTDHYGNRVTQRILSREEVCDLMKKDCTDLEITDEELKGFRSNFTYIFQGYTAFADSDQPLTECIRQLTQLHITAIDHYLIKIWTAPGYKISAQQLREFRRWMTIMGEIDDEDYESSILSLHMGIGEDKNLIGNQVKIDVAEYYSEMCWPPDFWHAWIEYCQEQPLAELCSSQTKIQKIVEETVEKKYWKEVYEELFGSGLINIKYEEGRTWEETFEVLEYLATKTDIYKYMVHDKLRNLCFCGKIGKFLFAYNLLKWCFSKGAFLNIINGGQTVLDVLYEILETDSYGNADWITESPKSYREYIQELIDLARSYGAKTLKEIYVEEDMIVPEYERELSLIKEYCSTYKYC